MSEEKKKKLTLDDMPVGWWLHLYEKEDDGRWTNLGEIPDTDRDGYEGTFKEYKRLFPDPDAIVKSGGEGRNYKRAYKTEYIFLFECWGKTWRNYELTKEQIERLINSIEEK